MLNFTEVEVFLSDKTFVRVRVYMCLCVCVPCDVYPWSKGLKIKSSIISLLFYTNPPIAYVCVSLHCACMYDASYVCARARSHGSTTAFLSLSLSLPLFYSNFLLAVALLSGRPFLARIFAIRIDEKNR